MIQSVGGLRFSMVEAASPPRRGCARYPGVVRVPRDVRRMAKAAAAAAVRCLRPGRENGSRTPGATRPEEIPMLRLRRNHCYYRRIWFFCGGDYRTKTLNRYRRTDFSPYPLLSKTLLLHICTRIYDYHVSNFPVVIFKFDISPVQITKQEQ